MAWEIGNLHRGDLERPGAVYVGRRGRGLAGSPLANPYRLDPTRPREEQSEIFDQYKRWLWRRLSSDTPERREIERLAGLPDGVLVCYCAPARCHSEVIRDAIEWWRGRSTAPNRDGLPDRACVAADAADPSAPAATSTREHR